MKNILLILFLFTTAATHAQTYSFKKATYYFIVPGVTPVTSPLSWWRVYNSPVTVTVDTVAKTITIPNFQMWETISSKKNLINGVTQSNNADTSLTVIQPNLVLRMTEYRRLFDDLCFYSLDGKIAAAQSCNDFVVQYPVFNGWIKTIVCSNE